MSMKAGSRAHDSKGFSHSHGSRLSLDPDQHVTQTIGDLYYTDEAGNRMSYVQPADPSAASRGPSRLSVQQQQQGKGPGRIQTNGFTPPGSPISLRPTSPSASETANSSFPLNDIDYESDPMAVAQEISNLQALRRMSMDVTSTADPDLPSFNSFVPSTPPDDNDPGSVFWVPARLHPELAPKEFSAYLEAKKNEIRRPANERSGSLSPESSGSMSPGLRRKKSMLSRQVDHTDGGRHYRDGAERLDKRRSLQGAEDPIMHLDELMNDPKGLMRKLSADTQRREEGDSKDDLPIIPAPKVQLKRSTATHYRRGSTRRQRGSKLQGAVAAVMAAEADKSEKTPSPDTSPEVPKIRPQQLTDPPPPRNTPITTLHKQPSTNFAEIVPKSAQEIEPPEQTKEEKHRSAPPGKSRRSQSPKPTARSRTSEPPPPPVPVIVETPPPTPPISEIPERSSSRRTESDAASVSSMASSIDHMSLAEQGRKDKRRPESSGSTKADKEKEKDRKTSWGWLRGDSSEKDREKAEREERKEREREEKAKARKEKRPKSAERHDNTRLDVLQKSIEMGNTGKVIATDPVPVDKESRKSRSEDKKDKDSGFFSFLGGRKKSSEHGHKKGSSSRGQSPDPPHEKQQPAFYYARFPIHIERAIYRLSHLKLANPRRPLHQQVLLSNFMYSYLAKVQQTQPHLIQQATTSQQQQQQQEQQQRQQQEQQRQQQEQQRQQQQQQYYYDDNSQQTDYVDDSQMYDYDDGSSDRPSSRQAQYNRQQQQQQQQQHENGNGYYDKRGDSGGGHGGGGGGGGGGGEYQRSGSTVAGMDRDDMW